MTFVEANGVSIRVELSGSGPTTLVLLHELGGSLDSFDALMPKLTRLRSLRYDQRGAGQSEKPRRPFTLKDHAADLRGLLDRLGIEGPVHLAGVAAGAAVALAVADASPGLVASLSLCAPALTVPPDRRAYLQDRSDLAAREGMRAIAEPTLSRSFPEHLRGDRQAFDAYRARFLANDPVAYGLANLALADSLMDAALRRVAVPCQVLAGRHDLLRPPDQARPVADAIPGATFAVVESGHIMPVQAPGPMASLIVDFVEGIVRMGPAEAAE